MFLSLKKIIKDYNLNIKGVIHIGAHKGEELFSYLKNDINNVILIEANNDLIKYLKLKKILYNFFSMKIDIFNFIAYNEKDQYLELKITSNTQSSSILNLKKHKILYPKIVKKKKMLVRTEKIDNIFQNNLSIKNYNFINIDIQGAELKALQGCTKILKKIDAIYTEINFEELYEDCVIAQELDDFLKKFNFKRVLTNTPQDPSWGDALYIK